MEETKTEFKCCSDLMNHSKKHCLFAVIGLFLAVITLSEIVDVYYKIVKPSDNQMAFTGSGTVYAKPDLALTSFSVITEAKTISETMAPNTENMNKVIAAIKAQGVEDKDIKTTDFSIYPRYEYIKSEIYSSSYPEGSRELVGYEMNQTVEVKIRDLAKVGDIMQSATDAGANQIGSLQFTIDDKDSIKAQAREEAIQNAKAKAEELASQLGVKLGRIISFNESGTNPSYYSYDLKASESSGLGGAAPQIETGENKTEMTVTIVYELR
jgi:hypothetical protein